eukprot:6253858-Lingulodinium_polyedra.AAC.1
MLYLFAGAARHADVGHYLRSLPDTLLVAPIDLELCEVDILLDPVSGDLLDEDTRLKHLAD